MPDEYTDLRSEGGVDEKPSEDAEKSSWWIGRWAHVIAGVVFCLLYFPFADHLWSWQLAITLSYVVFMLCCTCGIAFRDSDDFFGSPEMWQYLATLLVRQVFVLALVSLGAYLWRYLIPLLPEWATHESRRGSVWDVCGILLAYYVAVREASWIATRIKHRFPELEDPF
jgi:hypothetical protein